MKRLLAIFVAIVWTAAAIASNGYEVKYDRLSDGVQQLNFTIGDYSVAPVNLDGSTFSKLNFEGKVVTMKKGFAELPYVHASVMIDDRKDFNTSILPGSYEDIQLDQPLLPSRGVIYRNQDPGSIPYIIDPKSIKDEWYPVSLAETTDPYILRDIRGTNVYVYPFQYNAAKQVLRVYKDIRVLLVENDTPPVNPLTRQSDVVVREMDGIYRSVFINYDDASNRDALTIGEVGDILVITTDRDQTAIQPYIDWKTEKGYYVDMQVVTAGTNVNSLVQDAYDANNSLLYVLLVGDWADVKCNTLSSGSPMDPQVGCVVGADTYPDITVGRFSANSPADVTTQVNKVIAYEKTPEAAATWYSAAVGMASAEGAGIGDDGEADIAHNDVIWNDKLDPFTYDTFTPIYDPGASGSQVTNAVNDGVSIINYCGHGSMTSWGTSGFNNSQVANLSNGERMPFIFSVACDNGDFHLGTCFAEAWLRKENGGAVMMMAASISQPWQPPMRGQDYFNDILIGGYDYTAHAGQNGISTTEQRTTFGALTFNGLVLMCVESGGSSDWETAKTWNLFGDPATQARTATPAALTLSSTLVMVGVPFSTTVTTNGVPVANAMVALSQDGTMVRGITDESGNVSFDHSFAPGTAKLVVTAFNTETIYEDVSVVPAAGAYVLFSSFEIDDAAGNGNGMLDYNETAYLTVGLANVGTEDVNSVEAVLSSNDEYLSLLDTNASFGTIAAGDTVYVTQAFQLSVADSVPDLHTVIFMLDISGDGGDNWTSSFGTQAHAPVLEMLSYTVDDSDGNNNGRLDPDEAAQVIIQVQNSGTSEAFNAVGELITTDENLTLSGNPASFGNLMGGDTSTYSFGVVVSPDAPQGDVAEFTLDVTADFNIAAQGSFNLSIGQVPVLIIDLDGNQNSAPAMEQCLANLQVSSDDLDAFPANLNLYASIFVCLGTYPDNHVLTVDEGQMLADYLDQGGRLYMEGGDTWYYDQLTTPTPVHEMFGLRGEDDGSGDLSILNGMEGSIVNGMAFFYNGDNSYIDHIVADGGTMMFENTSPVYGAAVSNDADTYKTVGFSMEFGGLTDSEYTKDELMLHILDFFGIDGVWTGVEDAVSHELNSSVYPNPVNGNTVIRFNLEAASHTNVSVYNVSGQKVAELLDGTLTKGLQEVHWPGNEGLAQGIYFLRIQTSTGVETMKLMVQ